MEKYNNLKTCRQKNKWGYIDKDGEVIIPCKYAKAFSFSEGLALVVDDNYHKFFINEKGDVVIDVSKYSETNYFFSEGLFGVEINNKWGYINNSGNLIIQPSFDFASDFSEGLACVGHIIRHEEVPTIDWTKMDYGQPEKEAVYKYGYIDKTGKIVIPFKYDNCEDFIEAFAKVDFYDGKFHSFYIDKTGKEYPENFTP